MDNFLRLKRKKNEILKSKELGLRRRLVSGKKIFLNSLFFF